MANSFEDILGTAAAIAKGMGVTFKEMLGPTVTDDYPDAPPKFEQRFRGVHVLQRDVNGMEKCVACFLCAAACPSNCIYIEGGRDTAHHADLRRRALRQGLQHRLQPMHLLRLLCGGLPHRRDHARPRLRSGQLQYVHAGQTQRGYACRDSGRRQTACHGRSRARRRTLGPRVPRRPRTDRYHLPGRSGR